MFIKKIMLKSANNGLIDYLLSPLPCIPANSLEFQRVKLLAKSHFTGVFATFACENFFGRKFRVRFFKYIEIVS